MPNITPEERAVARLDAIHTRAVITLGKLDTATRYAVPSVTRIGYQPSSPDETDTAFAAFVAKCKRPVLVVGAGAGNAVPAALAAGAPSIVVNELSGAALGKLYQRIAPGDRKRLSLKLARFPAELGIAPGTLGAIHASRVLRYLPPADVEEGFDCAFSWLAPGGKLFVHDSTPYTPANADFTVEFELKKAAGKHWPGFVADPAATDPHLPPALHVFDADVLAAAATRASFVVETCRMFTPAALPDFMRLDGRECVELVARKPA